MNRRRFLVAPLVALVPIAPVKAAPWTTIVHIRGESFNRQQIRDLIAKIHDPSSTRK